jgi:hypothetical protein
LHVFDARQESAFIEKAVIHGYIEAFTVGGKKSVQTCFH